MKAKAFFEKRPVAKWLAIVLPVLLAAGVVFGLLAWPQAAEEPPLRPCDVVICGSKTVEGTNIPASQTFTFKLTQWSSNNLTTGTEVLGVTRVTEPLTATVTTDSSGIAKTYNFDFDKITFTQEGPYYFKLEETGGGTGWANDPNPMQLVTVYIKKDLDAETYEAPYQDYSYSWNDLYAVIDYKTHDALTWENPNTNHPFGSASYYGVFALGNMELYGADIEGHAAVGGNLSLNAPNYAFNVGAPNRTYAPFNWPARPYTPAALIRGNVTVPNGCSLNVVGGAVWLSTNSSVTGGNPTDPLVEGIYTGSDPSYTYFVKLGGPLPPQMAWSAKTNGTVHKVPDGTLLKFFTDANTSLTALGNEWYNTTGDSKTLVMPNQTSNTFDPGTGNYSAYDTIIFNFTGTGNLANCTIVFPTSFTGKYVINYKGASTPLSYSTGTPQIYKDTISLSNKIDYKQAIKYYSGRIFYNIPSNIQTLSLLGSEMTGCVLAPGTEIILGGGNPSDLITHDNDYGGAINGLVVCKKYTSYNNSENHNTTLFGCVKGHATFTNTYSGNTPPPKHAKISIHVKKTVSTASGGTVSSGSHTFGLTLYNSDASGNQGSQKEVINVTRTGTNVATIAYFPVIEYTAADTYYYLVKETSAPGSWSMDPTQYHIRVVVELDSATNSLKIVKAEYRTGTVGAWGNWMPYSATYNPTGDAPSSVTQVGTKASYTMFSKLPRESGGTEFPQAYKATNATNCTMNLLSSLGPTSRDGTASALLNALYPTNTSLTTAEFNMLFGTDISTLNSETITGIPTGETLPKTYSTYPRRDFIRAAAYLYEAAIKYSSSPSFDLYSTIAPGTTSAGAMDSWKYYVNAHAPGAKAHYVQLYDYLTGATNKGHTYMEYWHKLLDNMTGIITQHTTTGVTTSLSMSYTHGSSTSGTIIFSHNGWVSKNIDNEEQYETWLTWTGNAKVNNISTGSTGLRVYKDIPINVTDRSGDVVFTLTDKAKYVKADSIKGALYTPDPNVTTTSTGSDNEFLVGRAQFVTLSNTLTVTGSSGTQVGTSSQVVAENEVTRYINPEATFTYIQTNNSSNTIWCGDMNIQDLSITFHNTYGTTPSAGNATLYVRKTISGASAPANQNFVFTLTKTNENGIAETWPSGLTVSVTGGTWNETNKTITVSRNTGGEGNVDFQIAIDGLTASSSADTPHYFTLVETSGGSPGAGWENATNEFLLRVNVPEGGGTGTVNGYKTRTSSLVSWPSSFTTTAPIHGSSATNRATYTNTYAKHPVEIKLTKTAPVNMAANQFLFELYNANAGGTIANNIPYEARNGAGISSPVTFGTLEYSVPGDYFYILKESTDGSTGGWVTDTKEYWIKVHIDEDLSDHSISYKSRDDSSGTWSPAGNDEWLPWNPAACGFANKLKAHLALTKQGKGENNTDVAMAKNQFTFELYTCDQNGDGSSVSLSPSQTKQNAAGAPVTVVFDDIEITSTAAQYYLLKESTSVTPPSASWGTDIKQYLIRIQASSATPPIAEISYKTGSPGNWSGTWLPWNSATCGFTNTYTKPSASFTPKAMKRTIGKNMTETNGVKFDFELYDISDGYNTTPVSTGTNATGTATAPGTLWDYEASVELQPITYGLENLGSGGASKTFYYLLVEKPMVPPNGWVTNTETCYWVFQVVLSQNPDGTLKVEASYNASDALGTIPTAWLPYDPAVNTPRPWFLNEYSPKKAKCEITGTKTVAIAPEVDLPGEVTFTFTIAAYDPVTEALMGGAFTATEHRTYPTDFTGDTAGFTFTIDNMQVGTYHFLVTEQGPSGPYNGWVYASNSYVVRVEVIDLEDGNLEATVYYLDEEAEDSTESNIVFRNGYRELRYNGEIRIGVRKSVVGKEPQAGDIFWFDLYQVEKVSSSPDIYAGLSDGHSDRISIDLDSSSTNSFLLEDLEPGTYYYMIREDGSTTPMPGWLYDNSEYVVKVEVTYDYETLWDYTVTYPPNPDSPDILTFTNTYGTPFEFTKTDRDGIPFGEGEAVFELYECTQGHTQPEDHSDVSVNDYGCWDVDHPLYRVATDADGLVRFDLLTNGHYLLAEVKTRAGYQLPHGQWLLMVNVSANPKVTILGHGEQLPPAFRTENGKLLLPNYPQFTPPHAGSVSALLYPAAGTALVFLASYFGISTSRRRRKRLSV